ncbi:hypothetical protein J5N97_010008 [Dioscorea zingiberensis]|uniref:Uncharacterized protein n=1 Tax=Dioscorea zingiberensis TaxID=325984 RepID=A0A9D5HMC7_9LILI|nr:hypothetical protein J5N97_010008 [Dioscorea zingiberensis]
MYGHSCCASFDGRFCVREKEKYEQRVDDELGEVDEDELDLDVSWKMLDVARAIVEKQPEDTIEKVNILAALGEVSMEREDIETSLNDYLKALSILKHLVESDNRRVVELNFRICLVLEVGSKVQEAIPYCEEAISLCHSRLGRLKELEDLQQAMVNPKSIFSEVKEDGCFQVYLWVKEFS